MMRLRQNPFEFCRSLFLNIHRTERAAKDLLQVNYYTDNMSGMTAIKRAERTWLVDGNEIKCIKIH